MQLFGEPFNHFMNNRWCVVGICAFFGGVWLVFVHFSKYVAYDKGATLCGQ
jgi:hypothetical protein